MEALEDFKKFCYEGYVAIENFPSFNVKRKSSSGKLDYEWKLPRDCFLMIPIGKISLKLLNWKSKLNVIALIFHNCCLISYYNTY